LNELKQTTLSAKFTTGAKSGKVVVITNPGNETAFFIRLKIMAENGKELALPVYFGDNYITLLPGESREISVDCNLLPENIKTKPLLLETEGWNVKNQSVIFNL
jgi:hypothetical protein